MKRTLFILGLVSLINLLVLGGLTGYAASLGWFERERVLAALAALKGETAAQPQSSGAESRPAEEERHAEAVDVRIRRDRLMEDQYRAELARREREIQDQTRLLELQQLALMKQRETFEDERERFIESQKRLSDEVGDEGIRKELEILEGLKPDDALALLRQKQDAEVVWLLRTMDVRKARKIVARCESQPERSWIGRILGQLHERHASQAEALGAGA